MKILSYSFHLTILALPLALLVFFPVEAASAVEVVVVSVSCGSLAPHLLLPLAPLPEHLLKEGARKP